MLARASATSRQAKNAAPFPIEFVLYRWQAHISKSRSTFIAFIGGLFKIYESSSLPNISFPQSWKHGFRETSSSGNQLQKSKEQEPSFFAKLEGGGEVSPQQNSNWDEEAEERSRLEQEGLQGESRKKLSPERFLSELNSLVQRMVEHVKNERETALLDSRSSGLQAIHEKIIMSTL